MFPAIITNIHKAFREFDKLQHRKATRKTFTIYKQCKDVNWQRQDWIKEIMAVGTVTTTIHTPTK